jgi:HK97 family phage major capsid protein
MMKVNYQMKTKENLNNNLTLKTGILYRYSNLSKEIVADTKEGKLEDRSFILSFSSEEPVERFFGIEILDHQPSSVKLNWLNSSRAPLLLDHDPTKQIGVVESAEISSDGKARATIRFSKSPLAESAYQDVLDGIKSNISVGYRYLQDGIVLEQKSKENLPNVYRINKWEPLEISLVSIPADHTVGIGRAEETIEQNQHQQQMTTFKVRDKMQTEITDDAINNINNTANQINIINSEQITKDIRQSETSRINEILSIGDRHNMREMAMEFIAAGKSIDSFRQKILENLSSTPTAINTSLQEATMIGINGREARNFSILKAIRAVVTGNWRNAEFEKEASMAVAKKIGREPASFFIPLDVMLEQNNLNIEQRNISQRSFATRRLEKLSNIAGGYLVDTEYYGNSFIDMLRNKMLIQQMGAKIISGLQGDIAIPKQTGGATAFWVAEGRTPEHSQGAFGQVTLSPKSIAAYTDFTRKLVLQASPDIETLVRSDLATVIALEIDRAAINGSGINAEPLGILNTAGIGEVTITDDDPLGWDKIVDLESALASKNADIGTLGYLCNANIRGQLKQTEKSEGTAQFIWESSGAEAGFGYLNGYRVGTTNQMPADTLLFGNFADLIIGQWGVLDVLVDPYVLGTSGGIRIRLIQDIDIAIRHPESFAVARRN